MLYLGFAIGLALLLMRRLRTAFRAMLASAVRLIPFLA